MEDATSKVQTTIGVVALATTLIPCKQTRFEIYETIGINSCKMAIDPVMAEVCASF